MSERTLYIRSVPDRLLREAKAVAARRGITLGRLVLDSLERELGSPSSEPSSPSEQLSSEIQWFEEHKEKLLKKYPGEYLAVVGEKVIDHDTDFSTLAERVFERLGPQPVFMPRCTPQRTVRLRTPRRKRR